MKNTISAIMASSHVHQIRVALFTSSLLITGCAVSPPLEHVYQFPAETERSHIGSIAVISDQQIPRITFEPVVTGKGKGAARGAGNAVSGLLENCPHSTGIEGGLIALMCLALTPVAAVGGSMYGGGVAPSKDDVVLSKEHIDKALDELDARTGLTEQTTRMVASYWANGIAMPAKSGQEASDTQQNQQDSAAVSANTILQVNLAGIRIEEDNGADPQLTLFIKANAKLANISGQHEYYQSGHYYRSGAYTYQQWADNDAALLRQAFSESYRELALNIVENALLLYPLYSVEQGAKSAGSSGLKLSGLEILYPTRKGFWSNKVKVDSLQPTLRWEAFPRASDLAERNSPLLQAKDVSYELLICQADLKVDATSCDSVTRVDDIRKPSYTFEWPLEKASHYYWSVRARFKLNGETRVTPWSAIKDNEITTAPVYYQFTRQFYTP